MLLIVRLFCPQDVSYALLSLDWLYTRDVGRSKPQSSLNSNTCCTTYT